MPNLQRLCDEGTWGRLATIRPVLSPMLWTSIATGKRAWKHGIHGFSEPCPSTGGIRPISNLSRTTKAIWNIFNQQGWKSNVIGWWPSHPAEPINGVMISNHFQHAVANLDEEWPMRPGTVHPERLVEPLREMRVHPAELENEQILPFIPKAAEIDQEKDPRMGSCAKIIAEISSIHAAATACMQLEPWDFMAVYYDGIDHFGHGFMKYHPPRRPWIEKREFELYKDVLTAAYRFHDLMLGVLLEIAGEETTVMLISDHGFEPGNLRPQSLPNEPAGPAAEHSPYGIFCLRGPGILKGERVHGASLLDIAPTLLHLYNLPVGRDMDGKVLVNCFESPRSIDFVDSWDAIDGADGRLQNEAGFSAVDARETLRQLVELGYIDEPDTDQSKAVDETIRELRYNLAQAYMDGGETAKAINLLETLWERWPRESRFGSKLLQCHLNSGNKGQARATFDKLVERKKRFGPVAREELKALNAKLVEDARLAKAKAKEAGEAFVPVKPNTRTKLKMRRLKAQAGTNPRALSFFHGSVLALEERYDEALSVLEEAERAQTANLPSLYAKRGEIYLAKGAFFEAETEFRRILKLTDQDPSAFLGLARSFLGRKHYFDAAGHALAALELQFHNPAAHLLYGTALIHLGKPKLAEQTLLTALGQNPYMPEVHDCLARLYRDHLKRPALSHKHSTMAREVRKRIEETKGKPQPAPMDGIVSFPDIPATGRRLKDTDSPLFVVSGLPRSGTSLMMQMLEAGGIPVYTDDKRHADSSNPRGYYEHEQVKKLASPGNRSWLAQACGSAIKIVVPLITFVPGDLPMRVIFMVRPAKEVLRSQRKMLEQSGKRGADLEEQALASTFALQLKAVNAFIAKRPNVELMPVFYHEAVQEPATIAANVGEFLKHPFDSTAAASTVDERLWRQRAP